MKTQFDRSRTTQLSQLAVVLLEFSRQVGIHLFADTEGVFSFRISEALVMQRLFIA